MAVTQYIGARYVPIFADPAEWSGTKSYEPLTIVTHEGNSYTSRQFVPVGADLDDTNYWVLTGNYNAQVEAYRQEVAAATLNVPKSFETANDMMGFEHLGVGMICRTMGFYAAGDGGAAWYVIGETGTPNGMDVLACDGGVYANLIHGEEVGIRQLGARGDGINDDTDRIVRALAITDNGTITFPNGTYVYTRITLHSNIRFIGENRYGTFLVCIDPDTTDVGVTIGSSFRKADDGQRCYYISFENLSFSTKIAGSGTAQDEYPNVVGLNLCACERTIIRNCSFAGFGSGAIIFARAEAGAEGLGFTHTKQDGNYNLIDNVNFASCGKYAEEHAAVILKYKANSNRFYNVFAKGLTDAGVFYLNRSNENLFIGNTGESCAYFSRYVTTSAGNLLIKVRCEGVSGNLFEYDSTSKNNGVIDIYYTGVTGQTFVDENGENWHITYQNLVYRMQNFPPSSNYDRDKNIGILVPTTIAGDDAYPLYVKPYDGAVPTVELYNEVGAVAAGTVLGSLQYHCNDTSTGAKGVAASVKAECTDASGNTQLVLRTGTAANQVESLKLRSTGQMIARAPSAVTALANNNEMTFQLLDDTTLRVIVRGGDGTSRHADLTLA